MRGAAIALLLAATGALANDSMPVPLAAAPGDAARGRAIVASRQTGLCLLCHRAPIAEERFQGTIAPDLDGIASRLDAGQIRLRLVDPARVNPQSIMPAYLRRDGWVRVAPAFRGKPVLSAEQIEDVVAYLATLR